jgi:ABC-type uncharacterized transport system involved in gliding motility auxiliary subunit
MIVISDGDLIRNQLIKIATRRAGIRSTFRKLYDNKDFMLNCVNYLLDDTGLINIRSKDLDLPLLDKEKFCKLWQDTSHNYRLPLLILVLFGVVFTYLRKRKYGQ